MAKSKPINNNSKKKSEGQPELSEPAGLKKTVSPIVGIIMGSDSDLPIMKEAAKVLNEFEISYEVKIVSAHRTPIELAEYSQTAQTRGIKVIISGAGGICTPTRHGCLNDAYTRDRSASQQFDQSS